MSNFTLNPGGFIGALCGALIGGFVGFLIAQQVTAGVPKLLVSGLIVGAFSGNTAWAYLLQPRS